MSEGQGQGQGQGQGVGSASSRGFAQMPLFIGCYKWMAAMLPQHKHLFVSRDFRALQNGLVLCDFLNKIVPGAMASPSEDNFKNILNVDSFLDACKNLKIQNLFEANDLVDFNIDLVMKCILEIIKTFLPEEYQKLQNAHGDLKEHSEYISSHNIESFLKDWIEVNLGEKIREKNLGDALKSGVLLCRLLNSIKPGSIEESDIYYGDNISSQHANIVNYLREVSTFGFTEFELFSVEDLFEGLNLKFVYIHLNQLAHLVETNLENSISRPHFSDSLPLSNLPKVHSLSNIEETNWNTYELSIIKWANNILNRKYSDFKITNLQSLKSGTRIILLLKSLPGVINVGNYIENPKSIMQFLINENIIYRFLVATTMEHWEHYEYGMLVNGNRRKVIMLLEYIRSKFDYESLYSRLMQETAEEEINIRDWLPEDSSGYEIQDELQESQLQDNFLHQILDQYSSTIHDRPERTHQQASMPDIVLSPSSKSKKEPSETNSPETITKKKRKSSRNSKASPDNSSPTSPTSELSSDNEMKKSHRKIRIPQPTTEQLEVKHKRRASASDRSPKQEKVSKSKSMSFKSEENLFHSGQAPEIPEITILKKALKPHPRPLSPQSLPPTEYPPYTPKSPRSEIILIHSRNIEAEVPDIIEQPPSPIKFNALKSSSGNKRRKSKNKKGSSEDSPHKSIQKLVQKRSFSSGNFPLFSQNSKTIIELSWEDDIEENKGKSEGKSEKIEESKESKGKSEGKSEKIEESKESKESKGENQESKESKGENRKSDHEHFVETIIRPIHRKKPRAGSVSESPQTKSSTPRSALKKFAETSFDVLSPRRKEKKKEKDFWDEEIVILKKESQNSNPSSEVKLTRNASLILPKMKNVDQGVMSANQVKAIGIMRQHIVYEIFETEVSYYSSLKFLIENFAKPTFEAKLLSDIEFEMIFANLFEIFEIHSNFLEVLKPVVHSWTPKSTIAKEFYSNIGIIEKYEKYLINFNTSNMALEQLCFKYTELCNLLNAFEEKSAMDKGHHVPDILIMPIQRIPRYIMLLDQLIKCSIPGSNESITLEECRKIFSERLTEINHKIDPNQVNQMEKVIEVRNRMVNLSEDIFPMNLKRRLLKEGRLIIKATPPEKKKTSLKKVTALAFDDYVLLCQTVKDRKEDKNSKKLQVLESFLVDFIGNALLMKKKEFKVQFNNEEWAFESKSDEEANNWITLLQDLTTKTPK